MAPPQRVSRSSTHISQYRSSEHQNLRWQQTQRQRLYHKYQTELNRVDFNFDLTDSMTRTELDEKSNQVIEGFIEQVRQLRRELAQIDRADRSILNRIKRSPNRFMDTIYFTKVYLPQRNALVNQLNRLIVQNQNRLKQAYLRLKNQMIFRDRKNLEKQLGQLSPRQLAQAKTADAHLVVLSDGRQLHGQVITQTRDTVGLKIGTQQVEISKLLINRIIYSPSARTEYIAKQTQSKSAPVQAPVRLPENYQQLSFDEFMKHLNRLPRTCPASNLPDLIIQECHKSYVTIKLDTQQRYDIYFFLFLIGQNSQDRLYAIWHLEEPGHRMQAVEEYMEKMLSDPSLGIDLGQKNRIRQALQTIRSHPH